MSVLGKNWNIRNQDNSQSIIEKILANRGLVGRNKVDSFLKLSFKKGMHNPFLMKGMDKAIQRIKQALKNNERIMIFGDYDVDGISGTAIMVHALKLLGGKVSYRLPHRVEDGYGLSNKFIDEFAGLNIKVLITVDCGISCKDQIALAKQKGIDVIITDHHMIPEHIPDKAFAILHPQQPGCEYPFKGLTGAGVSYKLACALITELCEAADRENYLYALLDLASLGTVADLGPLVDENRIIVKYGLQSLQSTKWQGLEYLKEIAGIEPNSKININTIGFCIGPRINAAGRIDNPYYALQLLLYDKRDEKAKMIAAHLENLNQTRQKMVADALEELENRIKDDQDSNSIIIAWDKNWHVGILGLLAAKCVEKHNAPTIIMQDFGDELVGSSRGPEWFDLVEALTAHSHLLKAFGGHTQAAGFTVEKKNLNEFTKSMHEYAREKLEHTEWHPTIEIDCELSDKEIDDGLVNFLEQMEPFGIGNEQPIFLLRNVSIDDVKKVGKDQNHLHFKVQTPTRTLSVIGFRLGKHESYLRDHNAIDLVCYLERNEWKGMSKLQLRAIDLKGVE
ncbi:single-stranded-DNA-specific exonuclease RecJ [Patescibacteria group bacterium]|nr:single-stranded-DNA-specific exonuclease RecJ [Patescibacteria group bacterium]MBU1703339.1 single-stranded-DNA-specific exonuclease RecJ [Patescibacteria group bacterium]MBU1954408.1 single-stranded-DNA-specific exonuclease RecJ [Patescibacteria group bacterium]